MVILSHRFYVVSLAYRPEPVKTVSELGHLGAVAVGLRGREAGNPNANEVDVAFTNGDGNVLRGRVGLNNFGGHDYPYGVWRKAFRPP